MTRVLTAFLLLCLAFANWATAREASPARKVARIGDKDIMVYMYRPSTCPDPTLLFVFAGYNRNAEDYRDRARTVADRACLQVFAPELDRERFPNWRYHRAGVIRRRRLQPRSEWTGPVLADLIGWARETEGRPNAPYILFGHSAGAQFLSRIAAYSPPADATRIVIANPSVHVMPSLEEKMPYGFGGELPSAEKFRLLANYLQLPITIYLGTADTGSKLLVSNDAAMRQGRTRYERGLNVFRAARQIARQRGLRFNWRLVEARGVGHSSSRMLRAGEVLTAFGLRGTN